jgi:hypothetical protein
MPRIIKPAVGSFTASNITIDGCIKNPYYPKYSHIGNL